MCNVMCEDCIYTSNNLICINRSSPYCKTDRQFKTGCNLFESDSSFDENIEADFDDEW